MVMASSKGILSSDTFRFFRDLARNNSVEWMETNRDRYKQTVVQPLRRLCEEITPAMLRLDTRFDCSGRNGANFSRINRDTRFAKDKTPYRPQMHLNFSVTFVGVGDTSQLYAGVFDVKQTSRLSIYC